ncbi:MAG: glycosyltransferase family 1 protein [Sphingomonadaceae bacterium]|nr:glycosyltransferase family 1 protein [Sphingomonadaceae bacterium]
MRIAIATDAWRPQINGVVRTLEMTVRLLRERGHEVEVISPDQFRTVPCPGYGEIRLAIAPRFGLRKALAAFAPDIVHISTEGPIGWSTRRWCMSNGIPFTTAFHTRFPDYASVRTGLSPDFFWPVMRRFHAPSKAVLSATPRLSVELAGRGIVHTRPWTRGIDTAVFRAGLLPHPALANLPRPILLSVGRVAIEKNLESFLGTDVTGTKVVVGDGPALEELKARFPYAVFMGSLGGDELAQAYAAADVFVFPSKTDTFGLVMIEALACGVPVAGYPVPGPLDIIGNRGLGPKDELAASVGAVDESLSTAILSALAVDRNDAAAYGSRFTWDNAADQFLAALYGALHQRLEAA